jgi:hypothetical protein
MIEFSPELSFWIIGVGGTALTGAVGLLYKGTHARIKKVEDSIGTKVAQTEFDRQRAHVGELFEKVSDVRANMATRTELAEIRDLIIDRLPRG